MPVSFSFGFQELLCKPKLTASIPCLRNTWTNLSAVNSSSLLPARFALLVVLVPEGVPGITLIGPGGCPAYGGYKSTIVQLLIFVSNKDERHSRNTCRRKPNQKL